MGPWLSGVLWGFSDISSLWCCINIFFWGFSCKLQASVVQVLFFQDLSVCFHSVSRPWSCFQGPGLIHPCTDKMYCQHSYAVGSEILIDLTANSCEFEIFWRFCTIPPESNASSCIFAHGVLRFTIKWSLIDINIIIQWYFPTLLKYLSINKVQWQPDVDWKWFGTSHLSVQKVVWPSHELESCIRNSPTSQLVCFFFYSVNMKEPKDENFQYLTRRLFTTAFQCGHRACIFISSPTSPRNRSATSKSQQTGRHVSHVSSIA